MDKEALGFFSHNERGMGDDKKRKIIINMLRSHSSSILLLQETHSTFESENLYKSQWGNNTVYFSHEFSALRGMYCIVKIKPNFFSELL